VKAAFEHVMTEYGADLLPDPGGKRLIERWETIAEKTGKFYEE